MNTDTIDLTIFSPLATEIEEFLNAVSLHFHNFNDFRVFYKNIQFGTVSVGDTTVSCSLDLIVEWYDNTEWQVVKQTIAAQLRKFSTRYNLEVRIE